MKAVAECDIIYKNKISVKTASNIITIALKNSPKYAYAVNTSVKLNYTVYIVSVLTFTAIRIIW